MIVRDEEKSLARCLESVAGIFGETVIADTGSVDSTPEIAARYADKLLRYYWRDDFSAARNFVFDNASGERLFWLDADDVVEGDNRKLLISDLKRLEAEDADMLMLRYNVLFDSLGRPLLGYDRERCVRRGMRFVGAVHEVIEQRGKIIRGRAEISHRKIKPPEKGRNLRIFEKIIREGGALDPRLEYYYARELSAAGRYGEAAEAYLKCARDEAAWRENRVSAWIELSELRRISGEDPAPALFEALRLGPPRADLCCGLGRHFLDEGDLDAAEFWYRLAPEQFARVTGGFVHADFGGYIPYLGLCVVYDRLGRRADAERYNRLAGKSKPDGKEYLKNLEYFSSVERNGV